MTTSASPLVLLVEDDDGVRRPLEKFLQMHHFKVVTADTADDAIDAIQQHRPVAAIIDLRLSRGSGRDVVVSMPAGTPVIIFRACRRSRQSSSVCVHAPVSSRNPIR